MQLTEPHVKVVVMAAKVAPAEVPKRSSLPSRLPRCWSTGSPATAGMDRTRVPPAAAAPGISKGPSAGRAVRAGFPWSVSQ